MTKPLDGLRIIEFAGIGPGPFLGMILSDLGADVVRIDRPGVSPQGVGKITGRGRRSVALDLKTEAGTQTALALTERADGLFEGYRPGVMERMGLGPETVLERNPALVYGRLTGWGQTGPLASAAGHDINYIAISGALGLMGDSDRPPAPPLNIVGDYGGGALMLAIGILAALLQSRVTGRGQVIDAAMSDGAAVFTAMFHDLRLFGLWQDKRGKNVLDGSAPFYGCFECADGKYVSIGSIEPQFYDQLMQATDLADTRLFANQLDVQKWPEMKAHLQAVFKTKSRDDWCTVMEGTDICFAPVLSMDEAINHPHNVARETFIDVNGQIQPAPAPRFSSADLSNVRPAPLPGQHTDEVLAEWGLNPS